jgi:uncharacterized HhH-GPD family protein
MTLRIAQDPAADELLAHDPLALLVGMLLDQQFPMERAFASPYVLTQRMGTRTLDPHKIADADPAEFATVFSTPPALHRFPGSMAARVQDLARIVIDRYDARAETLWTTAPTAGELLSRLKQLPGFGEQKAKIFLALLGKQFGVRPEGWRETAGAYGEEGSRRSIADVTGPETLAAVREFKKQAKAAAKQA